MAGTEKLPVITKPCPECGHALVIRLNRKTRTEFLACSNYPACRHTEPVPESLKLRRLGAPTLF